MKKLLIVFALLISSITYGDELEDLFTQGDQLIAKQTELTQKLEDDISLLKLKINDGDEIIITLNERIIRLQEVNNSITNLNTNLGYLIDDQVSGYKLMIFKWKAIAFGLIGLVAAYIILRVLKLFPQFKLYLIWLP